MTTIAPTTSGSATAAALGPTTTAESSRDQFLQLLVTQLQNQDPLEPVKQEDFIGQLAQFSQLEGIENLNDSFAAVAEANNSILKATQLSQGSALIGREIQYSGDAGDSIGIVDAVEFGGDTVSVVVDGTPVSVDRIQRLGAVL